MEKCRRHSRAWTRAANVGSRFARPKGGPNECVAQGSRSLLCFLGRVQPMAPLESGGGGRSEAGEEVEANLICLIDLANERNCAQLVARAKKHSSLCSFWRIPNFQVYLFEIGRRCDDHLIQCWARARERKRSASLLAALNLNNLLAFTWAEQVTKSAPGGE